jgi:hypothetical protein
VVDFINIIIDGVFEMLTLTNTDAVSFITDLGTIEFAFGTYSAFDIVFNPLVWIGFITFGLIKTFVPVA